MPQKMGAVCVTFWAALILSLTLLFFTPGSSYSRQSLGNAVDTYCAPRGITPYAGDCNLCHASSANYNATLAGNYDVFCPDVQVPTCTDNDLDTFSIEGGTCGQVDCNDNDGTVNPNALEICADGVDNNCSGSIDEGCSVVCEDADGDGHQNAACGGTDCNDSNGAVNPDVVEICADGIDNNCIGAIDEGCSASCWDADGDGYQDAACGGTDCNDNEAAINPGAAEICDSIDNNCNSRTDENSVCGKDGFWTQMLPVILNAAKVTQVSNIVKTPSASQPVSSSGPVISATVSGGGTINPSGSVEVEKGTSHYFTAIPAAGYELVDLVVDGVSHGTNPSKRYLFLHVTVDHIIEAVFYPTIVSSASYGGSISPYRTSVVPDGAGQIYTITPRSGYHIQDVLVDGNSVGPVTSYTFDNVTAPHTISVAFAANTAP